MQGTKVQPQVNEAKVALSRSGPQMCPTACKGSHCRLLGKDARALPTIRHPIPTIIDGHSGGWTGIIGSFKSCPGLAEGWSVSTSSHVLTANLSVMRHRECRKEQGRGTVTIIIFHNFVIYRNLP